MHSAIPNYRLLEQIGEGGFGEVWRAETVTGKRRAVKMVRRERFVRPGLSEQEIDALFEREFEGVQRFEDLASGHPALIDIQHVGRDEAGDFYYYAMPLADNAIESSSNLYEPLNLERRLLRDGPLDWNEAIELLRTLAGGLDKLHRAGLCHGDISSGNVLFFEGRPVLADPGLTSDAGTQRLTRSPGFSESLATAAFDPHGDVFALGRLLYHLVTGLHPAESFPLIPADRLRVLPAGELAELLDRCCDPDPEKRFADAGEFLRALPDASAPEPATQAPSHAAGSGSGWWMTVLLFILTGLGITWWTSHQKDSTPRHVEIGDGELKVLGDGERVLWRARPGMTISQAEAVDLDADGINEVLCSVRHRTHRDGGFLVAYNADGSERWRFEATQDDQNYPNSHHGDSQMAATGFLTADWDGQPGVEIVLATHNAMDWSPCALRFLAGDGKCTATYWHPGHIHAEHLRFVRETEDSPLFLAFKGLNNRLGVPLKELPVGKQKHRTVIGLLDPRLKGEHAAPPGRGELKGRDTMSRWYFQLAPQWVDCRPLSTEEVIGDEVRKIVAWTHFGGREEFTEERVNFGWRLSFKGDVVSESEGDGHVGEVTLEKP